MTVQLSRRAAVTSAAAALLAPLPSWASDVGTRSFRVVRDGSDIGSHTISVARVGDEVRAQTTIDIAVKFLGITAYRYELAYSEVYQNGLLTALDGTSNDDGERGYVKAVRADSGGLQIDGSGYTGPAPANAVTTSYWRMPGLNTTPWISPQSGKLLPVSVTEIAPTPEVPAGSRAWRASDGADYTVDLWYDAAGDWSGCAFEARGELGVYTLSPGSNSLTGFAS